MPWARMLADLIVVFHASYVGFRCAGPGGDPARDRVSVAAGSATSGFARSIWRRSGSSSAEAAAGIKCPLTVWERQLRHAAGQAAYTGDFIGSLGAPVDLLPGGAVGLHADLRLVRPGSAGGVHPGTSALGTTGLRQDNLRARSLRSAKKNPLSRSERRPFFARRERSESMAELVQRSMGAAARFDVAVWGQSSTSSAPGCNG